MYMYMYMYLNTYVYVFMYMNIYINIYVYMYILLWFKVCWDPCEKNTCIASRMHFEKSLHDQKSATFSKRSKLDLVQTCH